MSRVDLLGARLHSIVVGLVAIGATEVALARHFDGAPGFPATRR